MTIEKKYFKIVNQDGQELADGVAMFMVYDENTIYDDGVYLRYDSNYNEVNFSKFADIFEDNFNAKLFAGIDTFIYKEA